MNELIRVSAQSRTHNTGFAWQNERQELQGWGAATNRQELATQQRNTQLGRLFSNVNLPAERRQPQSSMEQITSTIQHMFAQCGLDMELEQIEYGDRYLTFVFLTDDNMMSDRATTAVQYIREQLHSEIGNEVTSAVRPRGRSYEVLVWVKK